MDINISICLNNWLMPYKICNQSLLLNSATFLKTLLRLIMLYRPCNLFECRLLLPSLLQYNPLSLQMDRLLEMQFDSVMRDGLNNGRIIIMHREMNNELSCSSNKISNEKKSIRDGGKRERLLEDSQDWGKLQILPDRTTQFMRLWIIRNLQILFHHHHLFLNYSYHYHHHLLLLSTPLFHHLCLWHVSHLTQI